jgi:hypothetical protein
MKKIGIDADAPHTVLMRTYFVLPLILKTAPVTISNGTKTPPQIITANRLADRWKGSPYKNKTNDSEKISTKMPTPKARAENDIYSISSRARKVSWLSKDATRAGYTDKTTMTGTNSQISERACAAEYSPTSCGLVNVFRKTTSIRRYIPINKLDNKMGNAATSVVFA